MKKSCEALTLKNLLLSTFQAYSHIFFKILSINILALVCNSIILLIFSGIWNIFFGGIKYLEKIIVNLKYSLNLILNRWDWLFLGCWLYVILIIFIVTNISSILVIKAYINKKKSSNIFKIFFIESWQYFWKYLGTLIKIHWYLFWFVFVWLLFYMFYCVFYIPFFIQFILSGEILINWSVILEISIIIFLTLFFLYRYINITITIPLLIHFNKKISENFKESINLVKKNWWRNFFLIFSFGIIFYALHCLINKTILYFFASQKEVVIFEIIINIIVELLIFSPIYICFPYILMLYLSKKSQNA